MAEESKTPEAPILYPATPEERDAMLAAQRRAAETAKSAAQASPESVSLPVETPPEDAPPIAEPDPTGGEEPPLAPPPVAEAEEGDEGSMSLIAHLTELRSRLIKCLVAVAVGSGVGYYFIEDIMH